MDAQRKRLEKELEQLEKNIANSERQLADETFLSRAPAQVVESIRTKLAEYEAQLEKIRSGARRSGGMIDVTIRRFGTWSGARSRRTSARAMSPPQACVPANRRWRSGRFLAREPQVVAGARTAAADLRRARRRGRTAAAEKRAAMCAEPARRSPLVRGRARTLLECERVALNFLQRLSGIATLARQFADARGRHRTAACSTRARPRPACARLEKMAAAAGGVTNHRMGLFDAILIKNNHIAAAGGVRQAHRARAREPACPSRSKSAPAPSWKRRWPRGATHLLLDNLTPAEAAERIRWIAGRATVELSGGITLDNVRAYAETGADFVSSGAITHSAPRRGYQLPPGAGMMPARYRTTSAGACPAAPSHYFATHRLHHAGSRAPGRSRMRPGTVVVADEQTAGQGRHGHYLAFRAGLRPLLFRSCCARRSPARRCPC